jgi:hypothetical protein
MQAKTKVTKSWYVEGILDDDDPKRKPHRISSHFMSQQAASDFAVMARSQLKNKDSVNVRTRGGWDTAGSL